MKFLLRSGLAAIAAIGLGTAVSVSTASTAGASPPEGSFVSGGHNVVFVQTDNPAGNQVVAYDRADNGSLTLANTYATGGLGGVLSGSAVDHLASQGSLTYDQSNNLLYAVNAGSNSLSVFSVHGDQLTLHQVVSS